MKRIMIITTCIFLSSVCLKAQDERKVYYTFPLDSVKQIIISTYGYTQIENTVLPEIDYELRLTEEGKVAGWSNKDKLKDPTVDSELEDGILYIRMTKPSIVLMVGVGNYIRKQYSKIKIPANIPIEIETHADCYINGSFNKLVLNNKSNTNLVLRKERIKYLNCNSLDQPITYNGKVKGTNFFYEGVGEEKYIINSQNINIKSI